MLQQPFDVRIESADPPLAADAARRLLDALRARGAPVVSVETGPRAEPGVLVSVGVRDELGRARWLPSVRVREDAECAARDALAFLEGWGFTQAGSTAERRALA